MIPIAKNPHLPSTQEQHTELPFHPSLSDSIPTEHTLSSSTPNKAEKKRRPKRSTPQNTSMEPRTPPRAPTNTPKAITSSPPISEKTRKGRRRTSKVPGGVQNLQSLGGRPNSLPRPRVQSISSTPVRSNGTPSQAYAGPTFHASPAPSSLPIPKFFAKTIPQPEKPIELKGQVHDTSEMSSVESEPSPTLRNAPPLSTPQIREASPLDIFFNADRLEKEKARRQLSDATGLHDENSRFKKYASQSSQELPLRNSSLYSSGGPSKRSVDASTPSNFPSELDASQTTKKHTLADCHQDPPRTDISPPPLTQAEDEQQRKAKTIALKKLLLTPQAQRPSSAYSNLNSSGTHSLSPNPSARSAYPFRSLSSSSAPPKPPNRSCDESNHHKQYATLLNDQPPTFLGSHAPKPRPSSSYLRQELPKDNLVENKEPPSTPTPIRSNNLHTPILSRNSYNAHLNGSISPSSKPFQSTNNVRPYLHPENDYNVLMEDTLRRILKLDVIGQANGTPVQS